MKLVIALLAVCQICRLGSVSAKTNNIDRRIVIAVIGERTPTDWWRLYPYSQYVYIAGYGICTGQYVGRDLILTAAHCRRQCGGESCFVLVHNGEFFADIVAFGSYDKGRLEDDWMLLRVPDPKYFSRRPFDVLEKGVTSNDAMRAGFSSLRVIPDEELHVIKELLAEFLQTETKSGLGGGARPVPLQRTLLSDFDNWLDSRRKNGLPSVNVLNRDFLALKAIHGCKISYSSYEVPIASEGNVVRHFCAATTGDSGGAILVKNGQSYSVAGVSSWMWNWGDLLDATFATRPELFYKAVMDFRAGN